MSFLFKINDNTADQCGDTYLADSPQPSIYITVYSFIAVTQPSSCIIYIFYEGTCFYTEPKIHLKPAASAWKFNPWISGFNTRNFKRVLKPNQPCRSSFPTAVTWLTGVTHRLCDHGRYLSKLRRCCTESRERGASHLYRMLKSCWTEGWTKGLLVCSCKSCRLKNQIQANAGLLFVSSFLSCIVSFRYIHDGPHSCKCQWNSSVW